MATFIAAVIGIANPMFSAVFETLLVAIAVFMPTTCPDEFTSGPPELPERARNRAEDPRRVSNRTDVGGVRPQHW